jgi:hypothetical protein
VKRGACAIPVHIGPSKRNPGMEPLYNTVDPHSLLWLLGGGLWLLTANVLSILLAVKLSNIEREPATHCAKLPSASMRQAALTSALRRLHCAQVHRHYFSKFCALRFCGSSYTRN